MNNLDPAGYSGTYDAEAGHLALDFANTVSNRAREDRHDWLHHYTNLVSWGKLVGLLPDRTAASLLQEAENNPDLRDKILQQAIMLREAIYRIFSAAAASQVPEEADLNTLNAHLTQALDHIRVVPVDGEFAWDWQGGDGDLDQMIWPVVRSAADLLTSDQLGRVGECQGKGCGWLFLDTSRNHSRRWCSMEECGNRAKARRHYARTKKP